MRYIVAWCVLGVVCYGAYAAARSFKNPWAVAPVAVSPIVPLLPPAHSGCGKDCRYE